MVDIITDVQINTCHGGWCGGVVMANQGSQIYFDIQGPIGPNGECLEKAPQTKDGLTFNLLLNEEGHQFYELVASNTGEQIITAVTGQAGGTVNYKIHIWSENT